MEKKERRLYKLLQGISENSYRFYWNIFMDWTSFYLGALFKTHRTPNLNSSVEGILLIVLVIYSFVLYIFYLFIFCVPHRVSECGLFIILVGVVTEKQKNRETSLWVQRHPERRGSGRVHYRSLR